MNYTIEEYLEDVKRHLGPDRKYPLAPYWDYPFNHIIEHKDYFQKCLNKDMSTYKALLFFEDYKNGEYPL